MNTRALLNLGLLVGVAALVLAVYLSPDESPEPAGVPLLQCDPAAIDTLRIEPAEGEPVTLSRGKTGWRISAPLDARANPYRVQSLLALCHARSLSHYPAADLDLKVLGLAPPRIRLTLGDQSLAFGGTEALDQRRYVQVGETVHLLEGDVLRHLLAGPTGFVDLALLPPEAKIEALQLPDLTLTRSETGWQVTGATPASQDAPQALAEQWAAVHALHVSRVTTPVGEAAVTVTLAGRKEPLRFALERDQEEVRLTRTDLGLTYHLPLATGEALLKLSTP